MPWRAASKRLVAAGWVSTIKVMLLGGFPQTMGIYDKGDQPKKELWDQPEGQPLTSLRQQYTPVCADNANR